MIKYCKPLLILLYCFLSLSIGNLMANDDVVPLSEDNQKCASCHGNRYYSFTNPLTEEVERKRMNPYLLIDTSMYVSGVHRAFGCTDCHSYDYNSYPHPAELKLEPKFSCIDCHGGDETYAKYHFDQIAEDVDNSAHRNAFGTHFKCEMCHDLHTYRPTARDAHNNIKKIVVEDNQMCLSCHNDLSKYQVLTDHTKPELLQTHKWLPNQELHFLNVRCIECHTPTNDTLMVSHKILPKEEAVRLCSECHSTNSILHGKLYKYSAKQSRSDKGYYNSTFLNDSYVIGANRNKYLNIISLLLIGATFFGISIHVIFRIIKKK